ncbi:phage portal protein [Verrucomicrobium sp. BvORR034]|uniref:phage portal protein n=1 Tax=Verrucomicrobium sp. BvORR034 TaxID=1396418 RepID=UPI0006798FEA|nr:phage portal protein [Verrucomicrobium sp. BvORR034]
MSSDRSSSLNLFDRVLGYFAPKQALTNLISRQHLTEFGYHAVSAKHSRGGSGGLFHNASPNTMRMEQERIKLVWEARDQELNIPFTRGVLNRVAHFAVPRLRYQGLTGDKVINQVYEDFIEEKAKKADMTNRHGLDKLAELGYRGKWRDGDSGFVLSEDAGDLRLQSFEADQIGDVLRAQSSSENEIGGVVINDLKQPVHYRLYERTRTNQYNHKEDVAASRFIHLWDAFRLGQYRGHSPLATVMPSIRDLYEVFQYDMLGIKYAASFAGFIKTSNPYNQHGADAWDGKDATTGLHFMKARDAQIVKLPDGTEFQAAPTTQRPSGAFLNFVQVKIREIALGLDLPYSFLWDLAAFGGVTARLETRYADHRFDYDRKFIETQMLDRWKDGVLRRGIANGEIPPHKHYKRGKWNWGPRISSDILNDTQARVIAIQNGLTTATDEIERNGGDFEQLTRTQAQEVKIKQAVSKETEVPIELLDQSKQQPTALLAAMNERGSPDAMPPDPNDPAPGAPPPPAGLMASYDPKAIRPMLDLLKQYNLGQVTYDQTLGTLMAWYGISYEEAASMVPASQTASTTTPEE